MSFSFSGRVSAKHHPALYRFLERINLRSYHGRSMLCLLIDRAITITDADKHRYGAQILIAIPPDASSGERRIRVAIDEEEQPETARRVSEYGETNLSQQHFFHLLEIAAGLIYFDAMLAMPSAPVLPVVATDAAEPSPSPAGEQAKVVVMAPPIEEALSAAARSVIGSSSTMGHIPQVNASDIDDMFGPTGV